MAIRPVLKYGLRREGVHWHLYSLADPRNEKNGGIFYMYPRMTALEYGIPYGRFATLCKELIDADLLVPLGSYETRMRPFWVERPHGYRPEPERDPTKITPDDMDRAIDLFEQLTDAIEDLWDQEEDDWDDDAVADATRKN